MQAPRGTRDFGPHEMAQRRRLETLMRDELRRFNYREIQTPTFEELELFLAKSGEGIRDEIYDFKDKSGRELALRPELTAPSMRFYFSNLKMEPKPLRLFYHGACYRYDRPQAGRYREFWQVGCELIGDNSPQAQAELLHLALRLFERAGLPDVRLRIGHLGFLRGFLKRLGFATSAQQAPLMRLIDKKDMTRIREALHAAHAPEKETQLFLDLFHEAMEKDPFGRLKVLADDDDTNAAVVHLQAVREALQDFGVDDSRFRIDPTIARGLDYYTGLVFELDAPKLGAEKQLLGGGAYDLSAVFGQPPVETVGFALGFDRTLVALEAYGVPMQGAEGVDVTVASLDPGAQTIAVYAAKLLRQAGLSVELDARPISIKKALSRATTLKARAAILVGAKELQNNRVTVKDLATGGQSEVAAAGLVDEVRRIVG